MGSGTFVPDPSFSRTGLWLGERFTGTMFIIYDIYDDDLILEVTIVISKQSVPQSGASQRLEVSRGHLGCSLGTLANIFGGV